MFDNWTEDLFCGIIQPLVLDPRQTEGDAAFPLAQIFSFFAQFLRNIVHLLGLTSNLRLVNSESTTEMFPSLLHDIWIRH